MSLDLVRVLLFPFEKSDEAIWKVGGLERGSFAQKCDGGIRSETLKYIQQLSSLSHFAQQDEMP